MDQDLRPKLRPMDSFPVRQPDGGVEFVLRDPDGFSNPVMLPYAAAMVASLMDGERTASEIQSEYNQRFGEPLDLADYLHVVGQLDERGLLDNERFRTLWKQEVTVYLNSDVRPAAFAGQAYPDNPDELRKFRDGLFTQPTGPGLPTDTIAESNQLSAALCPHVDLRRAGLALAASYKKLVEASTAELFVILGSSHRALRNRYALTKKHFATPLGTVEVDREFGVRLSNKLRGSGLGEELQLFNDELAHRFEHSIEFQVVVLQHLIGPRRPIKIVPVLVGSFDDLIAAGQRPGDSKPIDAFVAALRSMLAETEPPATIICSGDLAHIGQRYGDKNLLDEQRLRRQAESDRRLLGIAAQGDAEEVFDYVASRRNQDRICGLGPLYTTLKTIEPTRGELLRHDQAVELDQTACVSFGSIVFYRADAGHS
jgi:MEMO1 family protein